MITITKEDGTKVVLTDLEVEFVVSHWYTNYTTDIFQTDNGEDLEEYIDVYNGDGVLIEVND